MQVKFKNVTFKNILSYGNVDTSIDLETHKNTFISATNGSGKSTIMDAICYGLYGKPYRNIKLGQLINSINKKGLLVTIEFSIGTDTYKVIRGQKPSIFEIYKNSVLIKEDSASRDYQSYLECDILKINFKTFKQIIVIGATTYIPFMNLSAAERRTITEEVLDISIFSDMLDIAKQKLSENKSTLDSITYEIKILKNQIDSQKNLIKTLENELLNTNLEKEDKKNKTIEKIKELKNSLTDVENKILKLTDIKTKAKQIEDSKSKISIAISKFDAKISTYKEQLSLYENNNCPTCGQEIDIELKTSKEKEIENTLSAITDNKQSATELLDSFIEKANIISKQLDLYNELITKKGEIQYQLLLEEKSLLDINKESKTDSIDLAKSQLKEYIKSLFDKTSLKNDTAKEIDYYKASIEILKDTGIKARIISTFIPIMNSMINEYLQKFDMFVSFELDETFTETIKARDRDNFSYNSFSEGERTKIDLAILFAWRKIAMNRNSISTNLLMFDETLDRSLDEDSVGIFIDILGSIEEDVNSIVISHRNVVPELFDRHIVIKKVKDFSILTQTA